MSGRSANEIATERKDAAKAKEVESWVSKLVEQAHMGRWGGRRAKFRFERSSSGAELDLIVVVGRKESRSRCSVEVLGKMDDRGVDSHWSGLEITCIGPLSCSIHLGSFQKEAVDVRRGYYKNEVRYRNKRTKVYFNGTLGKKPVKFSVP